MNVTDKSSLKKAIWFGREKGPSDIGDGHASDKRTSRAVFCFLAVINQNLKCKKFYL